MKLTAEQIQRGQAKRRQTLFPLTTREVSRHRALLAHWLRHAHDLPFYAIRQVLKCSPEDARKLVAKADRIKRAFGRAHRCTCPASHDHTITGHLPDCPTHQA